MRIFGLTGGIGSGKSEVASLLREAGIPTFDADHAARAAREVTRGETSPVAAKILEAFGTLDAQEIARLAFEGPECDANRLRLEAIVIPEIHRQFEVWKRAQRTPVGVYEATLLIEKGRAEQCDGVIVVIAPLEARQTRLRQRGLSEAQIAGRIAAQLSDEERQRVATHVIRNDGSLAHLRAQVADLAKELLAP